ncbi:hypothetical protein [Candidatus Poriferisodalis sp.]|uniref:hypothetical protein n=1 Tax=Candidatus Poriferisodalis sp. TaxID=3101277 RepID=UPI003B02DBCB
MRNGSSSLAYAELLDREPQRHDLVLGLVGAIGTEWTRIIDAFRTSHQRFGYRTEVIDVSKLLDGLDYKPLGDLPVERSVEYYIKRMNAGDQLRRDVKTGSAMAVLAIQEIARLRELREEAGSESGDLDADGLLDQSPASEEGNFIQKRQPVVYLLKSLKHPDEVDLLRNVYGQAFSLVAVVSSRGDRRRELVRSLGLENTPTAKAEELIARDEADTSDPYFGQNVRDTYAMSDVFVPGDIGMNLSRDIDRFVDALFGHPFLTPTPHEEAMQAAQHAALRSSAPGRQVGAALVTALGMPVVTGTNEVPRPGGGQFWEGHTPDYRDFQLREDPNPVYIRQIVQDFLEKLVKFKWLKKPYRQMNGEQLLKAASEHNDAGDSLIDEIRAKDLIEFIRCLHAEQAAIVGAARSGTSTEGAKLFCTTFPCHECAKLIVGSGIVEVYYVEPYPKSLVERLYGDLIDLAPSMTGAPRTASDKVPFYQFIGIAPRMYSRAFTASTRKIGIEFVDFDRSQAHPEVRNYSEGTIVERELAIAFDITEKLDSLVLSSSKGK